MKPGKGRKKNQPQNQAHAASQATVGTKKKVGPWSNGILFLLILSAVGLIGTSLITGGGWTFWFGTGNQQQPTLAAPLSGLEFSLLDHNGQPVEGRSLEGHRVEEKPVEGRSTEGKPTEGKLAGSGPLRGRPLLIYFGYTFCPDVCPTELSRMVQVLDALGARGERLQPVLVTVDPERDTVPILAGYVALFHPRLLGLTGSVEQIAKVARAFRVYYAKSGDTSGDRYVMDHSSFIYLIDADGRMKGIFSPTTTIEEMTKRISEIL
jgi:protein SCO1/2